MTRAANIEVEMPTVLLYNPKSTSPGKQRLPLSLMSVAAVIDGDYDVEFIDGNLVDDPAERIIERARATGAKLLAATVMPGPQLTQAVPVCKRVKAALPDLKILWGGYFPTQHADVCLRSGYVDFRIERQGEVPFRKLVDTVHRGGSLDGVPSPGDADDLGSIPQTARALPVPLANLPWMPYHRLDMDRYRGSNYL